MNVVGHYQCNHGLFNGHFLLVILHSELLIFFQTIDYLQEWHRDRKHYDVVCEICDESFASVTLLGKHKILHFPTIAIFLFNFINIDVGFC